MLILLFTVPSCTHRTVSRLYKVTALFWPLSLKLALNLSLKNTNEIAATFLVLFRLLAAAPLSMSPSGQFVCLYHRETKMLFTALNNYFEQGNKIYKIL
jgi:uncharacterized membrane protein